MGECDANRGVCATREGKWGSESPRFMKIFVDLACAFDVGFLMGTIAELL